MVTNFKLFENYYPKIGDYVKFIYWKWPDIHAFGKIIENPRPVKGSSSGEGNITYAEFANGEDIPININGIERKLTPEEIEEYEFVKKTYIYNL